MLVAVVAENKIDKLLTVIQAIQNDADVIELRLDFLSEINIGRLKAISEKIKIPIILTLRSIEHGGHYSGSERDRLACFHDLAKFNPSYIDMESTIDNSFITNFHRLYPTIKIIRSYHNFTETPERLAPILSTMKHPNVSIYKLITYAKSSLDNFRILNFVKSHVTHTTLVAHCMGKLGLPSRVLGAVIGNYFHYAMVGSENNPAPHCPDLYTLLDIYHFKKINRKTKIFALLGDPIEHSIGHIFHNKQLADLGINAVYLKIQLTGDELPAFFKLIEHLPFQGLSVTMPLKEKIIPYMHSVDPNCQKIGAANTVLVKNGRHYATNTDGLGAIEAIEKRRSVTTSYVLIIGAGGSAQSIAHECSKRKPLSLAIVNRTFSRAE